MKKITQMRNDYEKNRNNADVSVLFAVSLYCGTDSVGG